MSNYGILGGSFLKLTPQTRRVRPDDLVILWTDGLPKNLDLSARADEPINGVQRLAAKLIQDLGTVWDAAAILIARIELRDLEFR